MTKQLILRIKRKRIFKPHFFKNITNNLYLENGDKNALQMHNLRDSNMSKHDDTSHAWLQLFHQLVKLEMLNINPGLGKTGSQL